jgi:hypothetical protein
MDAIQEAIEHLRKYKKDGPEALFGQIELTFECIIEALSELENRVRNLEMLEEHDQLRET